MTNLLSFEKFFEAAVEHVAQRTAQILKEGWLPQSPTPQPNPEAETPIDMDEACELLHISRKTLTDWRAAGKIPSFKVGRRVYFFKSKIIEALQDKRSYGERRHTRRGSINGRQSA
jgi:excisionase family DNA binding protein